MSEAGHVSTKATPGNRVRIERAMPLELHEALIHLRVLLDVWDWQLTPLAPVFQMAGVVHLAAQWVALRGMAPTTALKKAALHLGLEPDTVKSRAANWPNSSRVHDAPTSRKRTVADLILNAAAALKQPEPKNVANELTKEGEEIIARAAERVKQAAQFKIWPGHIEGADCDCVGCAGTSQSLHTALEKHFADAAAEGQSQDIAIALAAADIANMFVTVVNHTAVSTFAQSSGMFYKAALTERLLSIEIPDDAA